MTVAVAVAIAVAVEVAALAAAVVYKEIVLGAHPPLWFGEVVEVV